VYYTGVAAIIYPAMAARYAFVRVGAAWLLYADYRLFLLDCYIPAMGCSCRNGAL